MVIKSSPQVLKRISIRWLPEPAYEDSETIALNVGGYFMDLRILKSDGSLQWSRAGERKLVKSDPQTFQWTRIIDSTGSTQADEAAFSVLPNGDDLETGEFSKDGVLTAYEEIWRDVTESSDQVACAWILQSVGGSVFIGRVGGIVMGMQGTGESFGVREEVYDPSRGSWDTKTEHGSLEGLPKAKDVVEMEALLKAEKKVAGMKVVVCGREYIIRGVGAE